MIFRFLIILGIVDTVTFPVQAQITSATASSQGSTSYTNGASNDTIFFYCSGLGELTATPPSGTPGWNFIWQIHNPSTNNWDPFTVVNGAPTSTISNLNGGLYRVTIVDGTGAVVGCYRAWISIVTAPTTVDVAPIPPGCGAVQLNGTINYGSATQLYNPPADPFLIDASTTITVCFSATHSWISDLGFYLVGPASCGSPVVLLSPNPGAIGQNNICNSANNVSNLCFTTSAAPNFNACTATGPYSGTYDSYGPSSTPINWSPLYGCDATQGGWAVQIYDCVGGDVGALTNASITISGITICGQPSTISYNSGSINSPISDLSCSPTSASIFTVQPVAATPIPYPGGFIWTANPPITIPNATTSLNPLVNPGPTVNTVFTLTLTGGSVPGCGGNNTDSEPYIYTPPSIPSISPVAPMCETDGPVNLVANIPGGTWSGPGIIDPVNGIFDPSVSGAGSFPVSYTITASCGGTDTEIIQVNGPANTTITPAGPFCTTDGVQTLTAATPGGTWSGTGITNPSSGAFDPSLVSGSTIITYTISGACGNTSNATITVNTANPSITPTAPVCLDDAPFNLVANSAGTWSGNGITDPSNGTFDPSVAGAGAHVITLTVGSPCPGTATTVVLVNALPNANAGTDTSFCAGSSVGLSASGGTTYSWSPATGLSATNVANPTASPAATTIYTVTVTNANGCSDTDDVTVTVNALPNVSGGANQTFCIGGSAQLSASGAVSYIWSPASGLSSTSISNPLASPGTTTTYTVTGTDANGCSNTSTVTVNVSSVTASATATPASGVEPLDVTFINTTVGGTNYAWDYGNGMSELTSDDSTSTTYLTDSTYIVTMIASNADGCLDTITFTIVVYDDFSLFVPNVFSPNNDGHNDQFKIVATGITEMTMVIMNRWGKQVASFTSVNDFWDGKQNGKEVAEGTYFYILKYTKSNGESAEQTGTVTLLLKKQ